jgi:uncharacterized protein (UPF0332 family)
VGQAAPLVGLGFCGGGSGGVRLGPGIRHSWFNKNFVHAGIFPKELTAYIKKAFDARMDADYEMEGMPMDIDLETLFSDMKQFIGTIKAYLEANPAT